MLSIQSPNKKELGQPKEQELKKEEETSLQACDYDCRASLLL